MSDISDAVTAKPRKKLNVALIVALVAIGHSAWLWYSTRQELDATRHELAQRIAQSSSNDRDVRQTSDRALALLRASDGRMAALEARVNESAGQYATLSGMYQELTRNRSDWLLSEVEHTLAIASQQLQLAGNVSAALQALQMIDSRLAHFDRPQLIAVKKAVARDMEALKALPYLDTVGLTVRIDRLMLSADTLPLVVDTHRLSSTGSSPKPPATAPWWERLTADVTASLGELVHIRRMDKPEALLLSPEQAFFLRENLKMRLLDARLALLQRDGPTFSADIEAATNYANRYFDRDATATRQWLALLGELRAAPVNVTLPTLADSLKAVRDAQGNGGE